MLRLASLLPRYGFRVSILTFSMHPESSFQPEQSPCPLYLLSLEKTYDLRALRGALALRRLLREKEVQVVQTFFESSNLWAGAVTRLLSSARLIWSRRDMGILRGRKHALAYRLLRRLPHGVHAVSEQVRTHAIQVDGISPRRAFTVHNGLTLENFQPAPHSQDRTVPLVLTIGNIRHVKGHDVFLRAAALVHAALPLVQFAIAGEVLEPDFYQQLLELRAALQLQDCFHFLGGITDLVPQLQAATLFVLPSRSEGFSNSVIEAMACGLPVVATAVGGNAEAVEEGVTGRIVRAEDHQALADAVQQILQSPAMFRAMGQAGRERAEAEFSSAAMMQKLTTAYRDILATR